MTPTTTLLALVLYCAAVAQSASLALTAPACCMDATTKPLSPPSIANYDCSQLTDFGEERCRSVWGGGACAWVASDLCSPVQACQRVSKYEVHYGQRIDVGECRGACSADGTSCKPRTFAPIQLPGGTVMMVRECECSSCAAKPKTVAIEVPVGECTGRCAGVSQTTRTCAAGIPDDFSAANGAQAEVGSPSAALLATAAPQCILGFTPFFDTFQADRCFGHTFTNCLVSGPCPLRSAFVRFCLRAANVILTSTDHLNLGANGVILFHIPLPTLNGGTWNVNEQICASLDLSNLPGGANILPQIEAAGQLDFYINDDTSVDFVNLDLNYDNCQLCAPRVSVVSTLYTASGAQDILDVKDCACVDNTACHRESHYETFFPGTIFEYTLDVGQCIGGCGGAKGFCRPAFSSKRELKAPEGVRVVEVIEKCACQ